MQDRRKSLMSDDLTKREAEWARALGAGLDELRQADIVIAHLPGDDGARIVKGEALLESIASGTESREGKIANVPVLSLEMAEALRVTLEAKPH
jgi:hypothetical protein